MLGRLLELLLGKEWEHIEEAGGGQGEKTPQHPTVTFRTMAASLRRLKEQCLERGVDCMYGSG